MKIGAACGKSTTRPTLTDWTAGLPHPSPRPILLLRLGVCGLASTTQSFVVNQRQTSMFVRARSLTEFYPKSRYLNSKVLTAVYRLAYRSANALGNAAEYPLCLAYGAMVACEALESGRLSGPFANLLGAAAGFDSGDLLFLGSFSDGTFRVMPEAG